MNKIQGSDFNPGSPDYGVSILIALPRNSRIRIKLKATWISIKVI